MGELLKRLEVKAIGIPLLKGVTTNDEHCPWCKKRGSFSVTKTHKGDVAFICHRASCGEAGYIRDRGIRGPAEQRRMFHPRVFDCPTQRLGDGWLSHLLAEYGVTRDEINWAEWKYSPVGNRLVIPVLSPYGANRGFTCRALVNGTVPKTLTFREVDDVWLGWYNRAHHNAADQKGPINTVVVVEDPISALKASRFYPSVALLGSYIDEKMVGEIISQGTNIVLCLDADATQKAYDYAEKFAVYGNFRTVPLSKDVKNMNDEELKEWSERL